jgi:6-pyruvoyltetrahydropterin/6-carboxytetrahydropterin synthase
MEVLVGGAVDAETGMVLNMAALDAVVRSRVYERFDHTNLNLDSLFVNRVPTTENLCRAVFELLDGTVDPASLVQVRVEETENNFFEYSGDK